MHSRLRAVLGAAAAIMAAGAPGVASAAVTWTYQNVPSPGGQASNGDLTSVSCPTSTFCMATDSLGDQSGFPAPTVEYWNGSTWAYQSLPIPTSIAPDAFVTSISCVSTVACTAVGWYPTSEGQEAPMSEEWNGSTWTVVVMPEPGGIASPPNAVSCASADSCLAVGNDYAQHWNGITWTITTTPVTPPSAIEGIQLHSVSCPTTTLCYAAGFGIGSDSDQTPLVERWDGDGDGGTWTVEVDTLPAGDTVARLLGVSCPSAATCFAAGSYSTLTPHTNSLSLVMRSSHGTWSLLNPATPAGGSNPGLTAISCGKTSGGASRCTAVGGYYKGTNVHIQALAEYWNGSRWNNQPMATPTAKADMEAISCAPASTCTAVGERVVKGLLYEQMTAEQN